jgi:peptide/nickel transport system ATP-binding protein
VPSLDQEFRGCRFVDRCDLAMDICRGQPPAWEVPAPSHTVRCHLYSAGMPAVVPVAAAEAAGATPAGTTGEVLLSARDLAVHFPIRAGILQRAVGYVRAVDGVSFEIRRGRTLALVGESGCGKTTVGKSLLNLVRPTAGSVRFAAQELTALRGEALRRLRRRLQMIFQDPVGSLDPRMRVGEILEEGMRAQQLGADRTARRRRVNELLTQVGLPEGAAPRYPHEFSGGQRQRISIARALAVEPELIVCDEPTSALDVSVQAQILNLLKGLQDTLGLSYLFITHNLSVVEYLAHEIAVMYLGRIVEHGRVEDVLDRPAHPYTRALLSAVPAVSIEGRRTVLRLAGDIPSPANPPAGCHFHPRCPQASDVCRHSYPGISRLSESHAVRCHLYPVAER